MPEPPRRKRFQMHLSTAIVMMFVAGVLIWLNTRPRQLETWMQRHYSVPFVRYGWPMDAAQTVVGVDLRLQIEFRKSDEITAGYTMAILDFIIGLLILFSVYLLCEWLIRHRAARKAP